jgi:ATP-dependent Clp protease adapter protein ClpS
VLDVLQHGFHMDKAAAEAIALRCHREGVVEFGELDCIAALHGVRLARGCAARRGYLLSLNVVARSEC